MRTFVQMKSMKKLYLLLLICICYFAKLTYRLEKLSFKARHLKSIGFGTFMFNACLHVFFTKVPLKRFLRPKKVN